MRLTTKPFHVLVFILHSITTCVFFTTELFKTRTVVSSGFCVQIFSYNYAPLDCFSFFSNIFKPKDFIINGNLYRIGIIALLISMLFGIVIALLKYSGIIQNDIFTLFAATTQTASFVAIIIAFKTSANENTELINHTLPFALMIANVLLPVIGVILSKTQVIESFTVPPKKPQNKLTYVFKIIYIVLLVSFFAVFLYLAIDSGIEELCNNIYEQYFNQ